MRRCALHSPFPVPSIVILIEYVWLSSQHHTGSHTRRRQRRHLQAYKTFPLPVQSFPSLTMKGRSPLRQIVLLLTLSALAASLGNWTLYPSCSMPQYTFLKNELTIVRASARSMTNNLNAPASPSAMTPTFVQWLFGTAQTGYNPISFPKAVFGGSPTILGLNNLGTEQSTAADCEFGDVVSMPFKFNLWHWSNQHSLQTSILEPVAISSSHSQVFFCNSNHIWPPEEADGETQWYDSCKYS